MRVLFISRAFPPTVGGIETQNYELSLWLSKSAELKLIANKRGKTFLPIFFPFAFLKAAWNFQNYDLILLGDGVLSIVGFLLKKITKKKVVCIVHGLDLTYQSRIYQKFWVQFFLKEMDSLIAVGNETIRAGVVRGIPNELFFFIPNGIDPEKYSARFFRKDLETLLNEKLGDMKVILTLGRLVKRKGVAWFIENVVKELPSDTIYIVAGTGPDEDNILSAVRKHQLEKKVKVLGYVSEEQKKILLNTSDLFVQPNIRVEGDMEGFGISVLEAGGCGLPVVASRLEGLEDAICNGKNGFLIEPEDAQAYIRIISSLLDNRELRQEMAKKARNTVLSCFSWKDIALQYYMACEAVTRAKRKLKPRANDDNARK